MNTITFNQKGGGMQDLGLALMFGAWCIYTTVVTALQMATHNKNCDLKGEVNLLREERKNLEESCDELQDKLSEKQYELENLQEEASVAMSVLKDVLG